MSIELAEKLKVKLTDKWVLVDGSVPELRRFANWTGKVKTVNMNGRALVEFDGPVDIGWYDIDPAFLTVIDAPRPKKVAEAPAKAPKPAAAPAAPAAATPTAAPTAAPAAGGKPSPLDLIRKQQAAKKGDATPAAVVTEAPAAQAPVSEAPAAAPASAEPPVAKPAPVSTVGADGKKLSPLDLIRKQGAAKRSE